jgi:hypothetical protein
MVDVGEPVQATVVNGLVLSCSEYRFAGCPVHDGVNGQNPPGQATEHSVPETLALSNEPSASVM